MTDRRQIGRPTSPPPTPPSPLLHTPITRASDNSHWLEMLRAQPWRHVTPPPHPSPAPPIRPLQEEARIPQYRLPFDNGLRYPDRSASAIPRFPTAGGDRLTSTTMRFLSREPPHRFDHRQELQLPPLRREDHREDRRGDRQERDDFFAFETSSLPNLRLPGVVNVLPTIASAVHGSAVLPSRADRLSISSYSDTTPLSSGCSTPIEMSAMPAQTLTSQALWQSIQPIQPEPRRPTNEASIFSFAEGSSYNNQPGNTSRHYEHASAMPSTTCAILPAARSQRTRDKTSAQHPAAQVDAQPTMTTPKKKRKKKTKLCTTVGCDKLVVDRGVCIRHGGGKRCTVKGCTRRAQHSGLCWKHGGYTICKVDGCEKRAKSRRMCWSHGGGTQCKTDDCEKIAVSHGRCWAHGGGKRCKITDCNKPAALRMDDFCNRHYAKDRGVPEPEPR